MCCSLQDAWKPERAISTLLEVLPLIEPDKSEAHFSKPYLQNPGNASVLVFLRFTLPS